MKIREDTGDDREEGEDDEEDEEYVGWICKQISSRRIWLAKNEREKIVRLAMI